MAWGEGASLDPVKPRRGYLGAMTYIISCDRAWCATPAAIAQIHAILREVYWSERIRLDVVRRAIESSLVAVAIGPFDPSVPHPQAGASEVGPIVGLARAVTDRATFAWLCDVFVQPGHRGQGLARRLIAELEAQPDMATLRRWCLATRDAHGLYERLGYEPVLPGRWMERKPPASVWQEPPAADA